MTPEQFKQAVEFAKKNPNDPRAEELRRRIETGMMNKELESAGMKTFEVKPPPQSAYPTSTASSTEPMTDDSDQGLLSKLKQRYGEGLNAIDYLPKAALGDPLSKSRVFLRGAGAAGRSIGDIAEAGLKTAYKALPDVVTDKVEEVTAPAIEAASPAISAVMDKYNKFKEKNPEAAQDFEDIVGVTELLGAGAVAKPLKEVAKPVLKAAGEVVEEGLEKRVAASAIKQDEKLLEYVTPKPTELTPTEYEKALARGRITPKTATQSASYNLSVPERTVALKYKDVIDKDPVKSSINIFEKVSTLDRDVGNFLAKNNGIFNKGELKNRLAGSIADVDDLSIASDRVAASKEALINNFVAKLQKNDMKSLWEARKEFDRDIESAFRGAPSLQKEMKIAFRNAIQDFISESTPDQIYKEYMKDMSNLLRLQETVATRATKERGLDAIETWLRDHPKTVKTVGWTTAGATAVGALQAI